MKLGDVVLVWGASGGLGSYATQMALAAGRHPRLRRLQPGEGRDLPPDGRRAGHRPQQRGLPRSGRTSTPRTRASGSGSAPTIRALTGGRDPDIVFEHPGRETFGASVYVARRGGTIVTCASTSGFLHEYDNRYLWMNLKRIIGSHFANYREAWEANDLVARGLIHPTLSRTYDLQDVGQAAYDVHRNLHQGKVGVLALAPTEGLGVTRPGPARSSTWPRSTGSATSEPGGDRGAGPSPCRQSTARAAAGPGTRLPA